MKIYPDVEVRSTNSDITFMTRVRKLHKDNKYYLIACSRTYVNGGRTEDDLINKLTDFHREIYITLMFGMIDHSIVFTRAGDPVFELDPDQTPEKERIFKVHTT